MFINLALLILSKYIKDLNMTKNAIQEKRMKSYFIESCMNMIRGEGVKSVSVRTVAERAGYSYATLYNYFKDLRELLFNCIIEFLNECKAQIAEKKHPKQEGWDRFKSITKAYTNHFVQYPGIYELIFIEQMHQVFYSENLSSEMTSFYNDIFAQSWEYAASVNSDTKNNIVTLKNVHITLINGMLAQYLFRRQPTGYKEFTENLDKALTLSFEHYFNEKM